MNIGDVERPRGVLIKSALLTAATLFLASWLPPAVGQFESLFKGFGAEISGLTWFYLKFRYLGWAFALMSASLLLWIASRDRLPQDDLRRMKTALLALTLATALFFGLAVPAMYAPILKMGAPV